MINKLFQYFLPAIAAVFLTACETTPYVLPRLEMYPMPYADAFKFDQTKVQSFKLGETVGVAVKIPRGCGYGEKEGTLIVRNKVTGAVNSSKPQAMREGRNYAFRQDNLAPGSYLAELNCDGAIESTCKFEVR